MIDAKKSMRYSNMMKEFDTQQMAEFYQVLVNDGDLESFFESVQKHQSHDQQSHGNWAGGETSRLSQKTSFIYNGDGSHTYKYGDLQFTDKTLLAENLREAYGNWIQMGGNFQMRIISAAVMGLNKPKASGESELSDWTSDVLETGKDNKNGSPKEIADFQQSLVDTHTLMREAHYGRSDVPMYRGIFISKEETGFDNLLKGDRFKMPLTAFTNNKEYLKTFERGQSYEKGVTFTLKQNARGFDNQKDARVDNFHEFVTQGEYEVESVDKTTNVTNVVLNQIKSFNPSSGMYED